MRKIESRKTINLKKYILIGVCGILAISSVFMTVETATSGVEVSNLRDKEDQLSEQNRDLEDTLVKSLSISDLEQKSVEMGYIKPTTLVYVTPSQPVAQLP
ncbi:MAG: hypothetical protein ABSE04_03180 [Candidatus Microgenomates bacterium]|jgi:hypothetical protein